MKDSKRILITGGAGFIGSHLTRELICKGYKVTCLDNLISGTYANVADLINHPDFTFIEQDIIHLKIDEPFDEIYNLACPASPLVYQSDPIHTLKTSTIGMINVLELARKYNSRILQASTSEIYGEPAVHPQPENYHGNVNPLGIRACYDEGKRAAEALCMDYFRLYGLQVKIVRIFNTYGPLMQLNDGRVIPNFILQALQGNDITIYGDGSQSRCFLYIDDLMIGLQNMMEKTPADLIGPINLGNPCELTIQQLASYILTLTCSQSRILYQDLPSDDPTRRKPDITLAKKQLNWSPTIDMEKGVMMTIHYFKEKLSKL